MIEYQYKKEPGEETVKLYGINVPLPKMPEERFMFNYYLPIEDQKYKKSIVPDARGWDKRKRNDYAKQQYSRRWNGEWWLIKGQPFYIPGGALVFFDYWLMENGHLPTFRIEALEFFQFWYEHVEFNDNVFGIFVLKCRRLGDTEKILFLMWERCTKYFKQKGGLQSYTDSEAQKAFLRMVDGNFAMPWFFRPVWKGSEKPQKKLSFSKPSESITAKRLKTTDLIDDRTYEHEDFLGSEIWFEATRTGKFDGVRLSFYFLDEIFKIQPFRLNPIDQWRIVKPSMSLNNEMNIIGKTCLCSTVERQKVEGEDENTVEIAEYFWDNSNPEDLDENGRTTTGLVRVFRGFEYAAEVDEFGFHKSKRAAEFRDRTINRLRKIGDTEGLLSLQRKQPSSPEEALSGASSKNILFPELCAERLAQIRNNIGRFGELRDFNDNPITQKAIRGNLVWTGGPKTTVMWVPHREGRWAISQHPKQPNGVRHTNGLYMPKNMNLFRMGCDPYDSGEISGKGSDGAFVLKNRLNLYEEPRREDIERDSLGRILNSQIMTTNTIICDYKFRPRNPWDFYEDVVKTCWYYGVAVFPETDKPGLITWMENNSYLGFLQIEPGELLVNVNRRKRKFGSKATTDIISQYIDLLMLYIPEMIWACHHPRVMRDWRFFQRDKRTKHDLTVASGYMMLADLDERFGEGKSTNRRWKHEPWENITDNEQVHKHIF